MHLNPVIGNTQPNSEAEGLTEPFRRHSGVGITKDRNYLARGNRTVVSHE
jgi:hypothetical protein